MTSAKQPKGSKEDRLAQALRDNLAKRKALVRAKKAKTGSGSSVSSPAASGDASSSRDGETP